MIDEAAKTELDLYLSNDGRLYPKRKAIIENLGKKAGRGKYEHAKAYKAWLYLVDDAAKGYLREHAGPGASMRSLFPKLLRVELAKELADRYRPAPSGTSAKPKARTKPRPKAAPKPKPSKPKPKPKTPKVCTSSGYAYEFDGGTKSWQTSSDDHWDIVMVDDKPGTLLGEREIDGARVAVIKQGKRIVAQTLHHVRRC